MTTSAIPVALLRRSLYQEEEKKKSQSGSNFLVLAAMFFFLVGMFEIVWPDVIPFQFLEFWRLMGNPQQVLMVSWPLFAYGFALNGVILLITTNDPQFNRYAEGQLAKGCLISILAGVFEEISFRWLIFFGEIIVYTALNWLFFGWAGFGIFEWLHLHILGPLADFTTLGYLHNQLFSEYGWMVGAAMLSSNGKFRDGHLYQGPLGWVNAWFGGMFFFYLMFNYGLLAAIIVHFLFDLFAFSMLYVDAVVERARGLA